MKKKLMIFSLIFLLCIRSMSFTIQADNTNYGVEAYQYMRYLNDNYPDRVQNTEEVHAAGRWIQSTLQSFGYTVEEYEYNAFGMKIVNYVVEKPGNSDKTVYIGAHYDCVAGESRGADDNASGVGVLLELAHRFYNTPTDVTLKFCFWDAEEVEYIMAGSFLYVGDMTQEEKDNCLLYMNLDCVAAGDDMYVYGGYYDSNNVLQDTWALNMADAISAKVGTPLKHIPEVITYYQSPARPGSSDNYYFHANGMTYLYFEASAWVYPDGTTNEKQWLLTSTNEAFKDLCGQVMHTKNDSVDVIEAAVPGTIQRNLTNLSRIISQMIREFTPNTKQQYMNNGNVETPTTEAPTTTAPTTEAPTTTAPTTEASTTEASTTEALTTEVQTTIEETTVEEETETTTETNESSTETETAETETTEVEITETEDTIESQEESHTEEDNNIKEKKEHSMWKIIGMIALIGMIGVVSVIAIHKKRMK